MRTNASRLAAAIISIALISGCAGSPEVRYVTAPLPLPMRPELPRLTEQDLECLSPDAYARLQQRDRLWREQRDRLEAIIRNTFPWTAP